MENSKETIFLGKLELMLSKFDELDNIISDIQNMIKEQPTNQQQNDWILSDYYHILENTDTTDIEFINVGKKIREARIIRTDYQRTYELIKCYNENKDKIFYCHKENRDNFRKAIKYAMKYLHEDYKYRVLTEDEINNLKIKHKKTTSNTRITKEILDDLIKSGMKNKDIAKSFDVDDSYISKLKRKYGLSKKRRK